MSNEPPFDCPDAECPGICTWAHVPIGLRPDWCHHVTDRMRDARRAGLLSGWVHDAE